MSLPKNTIRPVCAACDDEWPRKSGCAMSSGGGLTRALRSQPLRKHQLQKTGWSQKAPTRNGNLRRLTSRGASSGILLCSRLTPNEISPLQGFGG